jgi:tetratricopeptide (TPR) repeat protein
VANDLDRLTVALAERYAIERELGSGGMATVYLAQDLKHDRQVALKVLKPELAHAVGADRFLREIRITAGLNHPHILPLLDSGEADGFLYFVMPYVAGESLRARLDREGPLPIDEALRIAEQVASALEHAHSHEVIHRDIKPENILLHEGEAMVADFGIAVAVSVAGGERLTETGIAVGTPAFMSPEQASGDERVDERSDIYSLGCVLYEMVGGEPPHGGASPREILAQKVLSKARSIRELRPEADAALEAVLARALEAAPEDRFATAGELGEALRSPEVGWTLATKRLRAKRRKVAAAAALPVLAVAAVLYLVIAGGGADEGSDAWLVGDADPGIAVLPFSFAGVAGPELETWGDIIVPLLSISLDEVAGLRKIDPRTLNARWQREYGEIDPDSLDAGLRVARQVGARYAVTGNGVAFGDEMRLSADVYDLQRRERLTTVPVAGSLGDPSALLDRLCTELLRSGFVAGLTNIPESTLSRVMTQNTPALKAYIEGERKYRGGRFRDAVADFSRAVELDSTFALAHFRLSEALWNVNQFDPRLFEAALAAERYADRLPEREALLLRGYRQYTKFRLTSIRTLEQYTQRYPDDIEGWTTLGVAYQDLGGAGFRPPEKIREALGRAVELDPQLMPNYSGLLLDAFQRGDSADATRLLQRIRSIDATSESAIGFTLAHSLVWGDSASQARSLAALDTAHSVVLQQAAFPFVYASDLRDKMLPVALALTTDRHPDDLRYWAQLLFAGAYHLWGQLDSMRAHLPAPFEYQHVVSHLLGYPNRAQATRAADSWASSTHPAIRLLVGALAAKEARWHEVDREIQGLESRSGAWVGSMTAYDTAFEWWHPVEPGDAAWYAQALRGYAALLRGDTVLAIGELEAALPSMPSLYSGAHQLARFELGKVYLELGRSQDAERLFTSLTYEHLFVGALVEYYLGRTYEELDDPEEAIFHYDRFVRWWRNCDPELRPLWGEGREALARLTGKTAS